MTLIRLSDAVSAGGVAVAIVLLGSDGRDISISINESDTGANEIVRYMHSDAQPSRESRAAMIRSARGKLRHLRSGGTEQFLQEKHEDAARGC